VIRSGSSLPRRLALIAAAALIPALAGCEAGYNAPTQEFHPPTDGSGTVVGSLSIRNVFVLGAPLGANLATGQSASLFLAVVNSGAPDRLISITAPGSASSVTLPAGGVPIVYGHPVLLTGPKPQLVLTGLTRSLPSGSSIKLILDFQKAGPVTLLVPVEPRAAQFQTFAPPQPSASLSPALSKHKKLHPSPSPSASPAS
jgi:hypothetical protein